MKISEVIRLLRQYHAPIDEACTCDTVKIGDTDRPCTGIVTTVTATIEVIRKAADIGANLIIVHEPLFYSHADDTGWLAGNPVYEAKRRLLEENGIVVFRDHDHFHGGSPARIRQYDDLIYEGIMHALHWEDYCIGFLHKPLLYEIPETSAEKLTRELTEKLQLHGVRLVGNTDARIHRVFFCEHVQGLVRGGMEVDDAVIREIAEGNYDAVIPLETCDWTVLSYIRDAAQLGENKVMILAGHFNVEEAAMRVMLSWLSPLVGDGIPMTHIPAGDPYAYYAPSALWTEGRDDCGT